jgi:hypothetical protein
LPIFPVCAPDPMSLANGLRHMVVVWKMGFGSMETARGHGSLVGDHYRTKTPRSFGLKEEADTTFV